MIYVFLIYGLQNGTIAVHSPIYILLNCDLKLDVIDYVVVSDTQCRISGGDYGEIKLVPDPGTPGENETGM